MRNNTWIDISQRLDDKVACWPGDTPFSFRLAWTKAESGSVNVGSVTMSVHTGTHVDAPYHFDNDGRRIIDLDINVFIGPARVIHLENVDAISPDELSGFALEGVSRLLIRTGAWSDRSVFPSEIPPIRPELAEFLAAKGIRLIGLDLPSVDPIDSKELLAHHALARHGVHILEGLVLDHVEPGDYELAALPLALADADGSPVRAVLRPLD
jgi:arylformamidase